MSGEPETIYWREALKRLTDNGDKEAVKHLARAIVDGTVRYYPPRAISLETAYRKGLFDSNTGAWRNHERDDNPFYVRVVCSDFERTFFPISTDGDSASGKVLNDQGKGAGLASSPDSQQNAIARDRGGRPPKYDWESFFCEIIKRANTPDGLPERAELTKAMKEWCQSAWKTEPPDSLLREKIAKVYDALSAKDR
jgi:hypothetical protein